MATRNKWLLVVAVIMALAVLMSGCGQGAAQLGTADNPIVVVFVPSGEAGKVLAAGTAITDKCPS
jgi:ABC-type phosphate/phosphonate transport system substrate-binding protein